jgi:hypothetical protein
MESTPLYKPWESGTADAGEPVPLCEGTFQVL